MIVKLSKEQAIKTAIQMTPQYAGLLHDLQKNDSRLGFSPEIRHIHNHFGGYVLMYDDEMKIARSLFLLLFSKEGFEQFILDFNNQSELDQLSQLDELANFEENDIHELFLDFHIPNSSKEWQDANKAFLDLSESDKKEAQQQGLYLWAFIFSSFFNTLSLMIHGAKLTTLVPQAITGDDEAFLKAIQIDRMLLSHYPYFKERKLKAQIDGDINLLQKISYRESNPPLRGKIRYPALYMLFGVLDSFQWLNELKHYEILDICDAAGLHRFQNRIEDVNAVTKQLIRYRQFKLL
jgi:hypothetical protein